jgi:hypothetical protein
MSARKRKAPVQIVKNITYNIYNYFAAAPGPAPAPELSTRPQNLFPQDERIHSTTVTKNRKSCSVYVSRAMSDGTLVGGCHSTCKRQCVDMMHFVPTDNSHVNEGKRTDFIDAYNAYKKMYALGDLDEASFYRSEVERLRTAYCNSCSLLTRKKSATEQECRDFYLDIRNMACAGNDGCAYPLCPERGPGAAYVLQADHGTNPKKRGRNGKPVSLSDCSAWRCLGGVPAIRKEAKQIKQWICGFCHALEETSSQSRRRRNPEEMPLGSRASVATKEEEAQSDARLRAVVRYPKQQYVDARKREIGACAACKRRVLPGQEQCFDFNHLNLSKKRKGGVFGAHCGVAGLVNKATTLATLEKVQHLLDEEMNENMCNLMCRNCHARHTYGYPARAPVGE